MMNFSDQRALAEFEQASYHSQDCNMQSTAEKILKQLSERADALFLALTVIDRNVSPIACFHAAATLRSVLSANWRILQPHQRHGPKSVYSWLISKVVSNPEMPYFQRTALLRAAAFTGRRSYLEVNHDQRIYIFAPLIEKVPFNQATAYSFLIRNELVELITDEFLSQIVLSQSFVEREILVHTRLLFASPGGGICTLFETATESLFSLYAAMSSSISGAAIEQSAIPALNTLLKILTTDLSFPISFDLQMADAPSLCDSDIYYSSEVLENMWNGTFEKENWFPLTSGIPSLLKLCFMIVEALSDVSRTVTESRVLTLASQVIIAISSISKPSYGSPQIARTVLIKLLAGMQKQKWFISPFDSLRLAYADIWRRISLTYGLVSVSSLMVNHLSLFAMATCQLIARRKSYEEGSLDACDLEVTGMLLESWTKLVHCLPHRRDAHHQLSSYIRQVIVCYLESSPKRKFEGQLRATSHQEAGDRGFSFADSSVEIAIMSFVAILTRSVLDSGMIRRIQEFWLHLAQTASLWDASSGNSVHGRNVFLNDFLFFIRYVSAVVADDVEGEYPSVPMLLWQDLKKDPTQGRLNGSHSYARILISILTEAAKLESNLLTSTLMVHREMSQRIASELLNALLRVCKTYLFPPDVDRSTEIIGALGGLSFVEMCVDCCFQKAHEAFQHHNMGTEIAISATTLLFALASGASKYANLQKSHFWQNLLHVSNNGILNLPALAVQNIGKSLACVFSAESAERLVVPALNCIHSSVTSQQQSQHDTQEGANRVVSALHLLRGVARSGKTRLETQNLLLHNLFKLDGLAWLCLRNFGRLQPNIGLILIGLAEDILVVTLPHMCDTEGKAHLANIVELMKLQAGALNTVGDEVDPDLVSRSIQNILSLLFEIAEGQKETDVSEACYNGSLIVLHLLRQHGLPHPAANAAAMRFVWKLLYWEADKLWLLGPNSAKEFLRMLDPQRPSMDAAARREMLEAIIALTEAWAKSGVEGPFASIKEEALDSFRNSILFGLSYRSEYMEDITHTSMALLSLLQINCKRCSTAIQEFENALMVFYGNNENLRNIIRTFAVSACDTAQASLTLRFHSEKTDRIDSSRSSSRPSVLGNMLGQLERSFRDMVAEFSVDVRAQLLFLNTL